jgi:DNA-binding MarR family transcriptional regulator
MGYIMISKKLLNAYVFMMLILIVLGLIASLVGAAVVTEPKVEKISDDRGILTWNFESSGNYDLNGTILHSNSAQLKKSQFKIDQSEVSEFEDGTYDGITIDDHRGLVLESLFDEMYIEVNTERVESFRIDKEHLGYQTFTINDPFTLSTVIFIAQLEGEPITSDLVMTLQDSEGEELESKELSAELFKYEPREMDVEFNYYLEEGTYRLAFSSDEEEGMYLLRGSSESVYEGGAYYKSEIGNETEEESTLRRGTEDSGGDLDFEMFALEYVESGVYMSKIFYAERPGYWTGIKWSGSVPEEQSEMSIIYRTGNSTEVESESWSPWSDNIELSEEEDIQIPWVIASSIQYKILMNTGNVFQSPSLNEITLIYDNYPELGTIETSDFDTTNKTKWSNFTYISELNEQDIAFYYSTDSGISWQPMPENTTEPFAESTRLRLMAKLFSDTGLETPELIELKVEYREIVEIIVEDPVIEPDNEGGDDAPLIPIDDPVVMAATVSALAGAVALGGYGLATETGKYAFLKYLLFAVIPLYSKIEREKVLDHYLRNQIYKYIQANPGSSFSDIMKDVGVKNGVLVHHLTTLEREDLVKSNRDGMYRRFYPEGVMITKKEIDDLSWFQLGIFNIIRKQPGITPNEIAGELDKSKQVINYHLNIIKKADLIRTDVEGKHRKLYVTYDETAFRNN